MPLSYIRINQIERTQAKPISRAVANMKIQAVNSNIFSPLKKLRNNLGFGAFSAQRAPLRCPHCSDFLQRPPGTQPGGERTRKGGGVAVARCRLHSKLWQTEETDTDMTACRGQYKVQTCEPQGEQRFLSCLLSAFRGRASTPLGRKRFAGFV